MTREPSVLLLEFNELCPALMDRWIEEGKLPNFQALRTASQVYTTDAEETEANLAPEIQWITVHSGLSYAEHKISISQKVMLSQPAVSGTSCPSTIAESGFAAA